MDLGPYIYIYINSILRKVYTGTVITFLFIQTDHGKGIHVASVFTIYETGTSLDWAVRDVAPW